MKKKLLAFGLAVGCFFGASTEVDAAKFTDLPDNNSLAPIVEELNDHGIVSGYPDGTYRPNAKMERQHVAALLARAVPLPAVKEQRYFKDVLVTHRNFADILALQRAGVIDGTAHGYFQPKGQITRAQMAKMLAQAFDLKNNGKSHPFKDVPNNHWANGPISALYANGIAAGNSHGNFQPEGIVTRGEYARFLHRALLLQGNGQIEKPTHQPPQKVEKFSHKNGKLYFYDIAGGSTRNHVMNYFGKPTRTEYDSNFDHEFLHYGNISFGIQSGKVDRIYIPATKREFNNIRSKHTGPIFLEYGDMVILTNEDFTHLLYYSSIDQNISLGFTDYTRYVDMRDGHMQRIQ